MSIKTRSRKRKSKLKALWNIFSFSVAMVSAYGFCAIIIYAYPHKPVLAADALPDASAVSLEQALDEFCDKKPDCNITDLIKLSELHE